MRNPGLGINHVCLLQSRATASKLHDQGNLCNLKIQSASLNIEVQSIAIAQTAHFKKQSNICLVDFYAGNAQELWFLILLNLPSADSECRLPFLPPPQTIAAARMTDTLSPSPSRQKMATVLVAGVRIVPVHWRDEGCKRPRPRQGLCTPRAKKDFWIMIWNHTGTFLVKLWWFIIGAFFIGYSSSLIIRQNILNQFQKMKIWNGGQLRKCFCIIDKVKRLSCATLRKFFLSGKISWIYHNSQWIGIYDYYYLYISYIYIYHYYYRIENWACVAS